MHLIVGRCPGRFPCSEVVPKTSVSAPTLVSASPWMEAMYMPAAAVRSHLVPPLARTLRD